jgi:hypothetical protein
LPLHVPFGMQHVFVVVSQTPDEHEQGIVPPQLSDAFVLHAFPHPLVGVQQLVW